MSVSGTRIVYPVSLADIDRVLGTNHGDIGSQCRDSHVNMWSRIKPLRDLSLGIEINQNNYWRKENFQDKCGILITSVSGASNLRSLYLNGQTCFEYLQPRQNVDWMRFLDFDGYDHSARNPFGKEFICVPSEVIMGQYVGMYTTERVLDQYGVQPQWLGTHQYQDLKDFYFGIYLYGNSSKVVTSTQKLVTTQEGQTMINCSLDLSTAGLAAGTYTLYPLLSDTIKTSGTEGNFVDIPGMAPATLIIGNDMMLDMGNSHAYIESSRQAVNVTVVGLNATNRSVQFTGSIYLYDGLGVLRQTESNVVINVGAGSVQNPASGSTTKRMLATDITDNWSIIVSFNNGRFEEPMRLQYTT